LLLLDVNVLVYAHRRDAPRHTEYRRWLESTAAAAEPFGAPPAVWCGFVRIATHPRVWHEPSTHDQAFAFADTVRGCASYVHVAPGARHFDLFLRLCRETAAQGNLVTDAFFAAIAIEHGADWISADSDFARFRGLRWRRPLDERRAQ
jgi:toxin-antitoxin system PIN domain toxin